MPKLIDYPRTTYAGAWELAEITDDTGGKCAIETAARKLNRKVSGSFKAIIGSAVKFGLITSKRDLLTTTTLFKRIKHAYDKQEELLFHRESFLTPPLFTQLCRKFRSRELPVQMLDVMLIREFGVEEINAQGVAKAFVEGCRMVGLLDERNMIADIDATSAQAGPRRQIASPQPKENTFREANNPNDELLLHPQNTADENNSRTQRNRDTDAWPNTDTRITSNPTALPTAGESQSDAIETLFGLSNSGASPRVKPHKIPVDDYRVPEKAQDSGDASLPRQSENLPAESATMNFITSETQRLTSAYKIQVSGPGVNTTLSITDEEDIAIAIALLQKIRRQLNARQHNNV